MFSLFNGIYDSYLAPSQMNLLIVGAPSVGKTALLERLKVTEIPTRVKSNRGGTSKGVADRLDAEPLTMMLHATFIATGAQKVPQLGRPSTIIINDNKTNDAVVRKTPPGNGRANPSDSPAQKSSIAVPSIKMQPAKSASSSSTVKVTQRRRFNFCPAPERYLKSRDDDDDEVIEEVDADLNHAEQEHLLEPLSGRHSTQEQEHHFQDDIVNEPLNSSHQSPSNPPRRVRCHSKEFNVDSLDLMDGRRSSLEDIPIDRDGSSSSLPPLPVQQQDMDENQNERNSDGRNADTSKRVSQSYSQSVSPGEPLLQSSPEEYYLKPKANMLPLKMIRPTSKCVCDNYYIWWYGFRLSDAYPQPSYLALRICSFCMK
jgi:hypothetical protein